MRLSVTSVILPDLDVAETCRLLKSLGYDGVEWRVRYTPPEAANGGYTFWGDHKTALTPENLARRADEVLRITEDYGLEIPCLASNLRSREIDDVKRLAEGAAALGGVPIRLQACEGYDRSANYNEVYARAVDSFATALDVVRPFGVKVFVEMHERTLMVSASLAYRLVSNFAADEIGVIYDVNNMAKDGFETFRLAMELLGPYLQHCHAGGWRPCPGSRREDGTLEWSYEGCDLADGILDVRQFVTDLKTVGYDRFVSVEDFREMDYTEKLSAQLRYLRALDQATG